MIARSAVLVLCAALLFVPPAHAQASSQASFSVKLDPVAQTMSVVVEMPVAGADAVTVRLPIGMAITDASVDGVAAEVTTTSDASVIAVPETGERAWLKVTYRNQGPPDPARANEAWAPAAYEADGSFVPDIAWYARFDPSPTHYRLTLDVPAGQVAVASSALVKEEQGADGYRAVFEGDLGDGAPALFSGPYQVAERQHGAIRLRTYFHEESTPLSTGYLDQATIYLDEYAERVGPYPFSDFFMVSATLPVGFGFPGLTYFSRRILPMPFMRTRSLAHEVLHNWWGNGVRPDYDNGNWSEGLTTYMADYRLAEADSPVAARDMRFGWLRDFAALPDWRDVPVTAFIVREHTAAQVVGYGKVASIFHMLRAELGEATFDAAIKNLWRDHARRTAGWDDLTSVFSATAERDLSGFFDQWTKRRGAPAFALAKANATPQGDAWRVEVTVIQSAPLYRLTLPLVIETENGRHDVSVRLDGRRARADFTVEAKPRVVAIDPDYQLFRRLAPGEAPPILRDVTLDDGALLVVAGESPEIDLWADSLASRMIEQRSTPKPPRAASIAEAGDHPVILIGLTDAIDRALADANLAGVSDSLAGRGTARAWAARRSNRAPILIVAADNVDALAALARPLPHYGSRSYVVFDATNAIDKGLWPVTDDHPLRRRLD